jgi:cyanate lyase
MKKLKHKFSDKKENQKERYKKFLMAMIDKNLTQEDLAKMLGCSDVFVCYLLWGRRKSKDKEKKLCEILGIDYKDVA